MTIKHRHTKYIKLNCLKTIESIFVVVVEGQMMKEETQL